MDEAMQRKCDQLVKSLMKRSQGVHFSRPVEWKKMGLLDYPKLIKEPMDLGTVQARLRGTLARARSGRELKAKHEEEGGGGGSGGGFIRVCVRGEGGVYGHTNIICTPPTQLTLCFSSSLSFARVQCVRLARAAASAATR